MTKKEFIEKAIEGGWSNYRTDEKELDGSFRLIDTQWIYAIDLEKIFLDPKAWEAVGKVEGWTDDHICSHSPRECITHEVKRRMFDMIDHLIEGGDIKSFIELLK